MVALYCEVTIGYNPSRAGLALWSGGTSSTMAASLAKALPGRGRLHMLMPPCLFCTDNHEWNIQARMKMTSPPSPRVARVGGAGVHALPRRGERARVERGGVVLWVKHLIRS